MGVSELLDTLKLAPFRQRFPWLGPDLQTLRDTLRASGSRSEEGLTKEFVLPDGDRLLARLDPPLVAPPGGLVVVVHGLGGGSDDAGQRRLGQALSAVGFAVVRLNLRGAGPGRPLAHGTYAASCSGDLLPVLRECRHLAAELAEGGSPLPLGAVGISLGGTALLNALLDHGCADAPLLDGVMCISSPLDLARCADAFSRPRNRLYARWMVRRLIAQTLADPRPLSAREREGLTGSARPRTIRAFDALITAPRLGFADVDAYYAACSPFPRLRQIPREGMGETPPPVMLLHAMDDPWVPVGPALALAAVGRGSMVREGGLEAGGWPEVVITPSGGHSGFHAPGDRSTGRWSDRLAALWLRRVLVDTPGAHPGAAVPGRPIRP